MATGTREDPWILTTPPGTSRYQMYKDDSNDPATIVCIVGTTKLGYLYQAIEDTMKILADRGDWMVLGSADEQKIAAPGSLEAWARDPSNPVGGWYGTKKGLRGRFGMYIPPLLEELGLVELEHNARGNRIRAK